MSEKEVSENKGLSQSFAEQIVSDVIKPSYKQQLLQGIQAQTFWKQWAHRADILSHMTAGITTVFIGYSMYDPYYIFQVISIVFAVATQVFKALASLSSTEEFKAMNTNQMITNQILSAIAHGKESLEEEDDDEEEKEEATQRQKKVPK